MRVFVFALCVAMAIAARPSRYNKSQYKKSASADEVVVKEAAPGYLLITGRSDVPDFIMDTKSFESAMARYAGETRDDVEATAYPVYWSYYPKNGFYYLTDEDSTISFDPYPNGKPVQAYYPGGGGGGYPPSYPSYPQPSPPAYYPPPPPPPPVYTPPAPVYPSPPSYPSYPSPPPAYGGGSYTSIYNPLKNRPTQNLRSLLTKYVELNKNKNN